MLRIPLIILACVLVPRLYAQTFLNSLAEAESKQQNARMNPPAVLAANTSDFVYQRCEWRVDPSVNFIQGKITTYFIPSLPLPDIQFDLSVALTVDSVTHHGNPLSFSHAINILDANFTSALASNVLDSVSVFYHGAPDTTIDGFHVDVHGANNTPVMWTLSEPYGAMNWWPCKQNLADKIDSIDVIVTCPRQFRCAGNGILAKDSVNANDRIDTWKHRYPIAAYLVCFAVSDYSVFTVEVPYAGDTVDVINYFYPEDSAYAHFAIQQDIVPQMQLLDTLFGLYPFADEKYGHTECNLGGGMEHQTMTFVGGLWFELEVHELAHHWFGDKVTCGSWEDIWLNEGFATYLTGICYEHFAPNLYWYPWLAAKNYEITTQPDGSVWVDDTTSASRIFDPRLSYAKGAMVLHQLRWVIGDSAWFAAVNTYLNTYAYGFANTGNLQTEFETASGQNLQWYFNDWYYGEGYPTYTLNWSQDTGDVATVTIQQTQSDASVPFYELPLPLYFKNGTNDTIVRVNYSTNGEQFIIPLSFTADSLIFDPYIWLITDSAIVNNVPEIQLPASFTVFPNPADNQLIFQTPHRGTCEVSIYDMQGRLVSKISASADGSGRGTVDLSKLTSGCYHIEVLQEGMTFTTSFTKR